MVQIILSQPPAVNKSVYREAAYMKWSRQSCHASWIITFVFTLLFTAFTCAASGVVYLFELRKHQNLWKKNILNSPMLVGFYQIADEWSEKCWSERAFVEDYEVRRRHLRFKGRNWKGFKLLLTWNSFVFVTLVKLPSLFDPFTPFDCLHLLSCSIKIVTTQLLMTCEIQKIFFYCRFNWIETNMYLEWRRKLYWIHSCLKVFEAFVSSAIKREYNIARILNVFASDLNDEISFWRIMWFHGNLINFPFDTTACSLIYINNDYRQVNNQLAM